MNTAKFLSIIWPNKLIKFETVELRAFKQGDSKRIRREFFNSVEDFLRASKSYEEGWDVYFGVCTRFQNGGRKRDCYRCKCVWMDLDNTSIEDVDINPAPDLYVKSGSGLHLYWVLKEPIIIKDGRWREVEAVNRALARKFGGDRASIDVARILRLPNTFNYKTDPPQRVEVVRCTV